MDLKELYASLILEHNQDKRNKRDLKDFDLEERGHNPNCGDDLKIQIKIKDNIIEDVAYSGQGCAISQASASMMIDDVKGKSVEDALRIVEMFLKMIKKEIIDEDELLELEDALVLKNISNMPARVKCAILAWRTLKEALNNKQIK